MVERVDTTVDSRSPWVYIVCGGDFGGFMKKLLFSTTLILILAGCSFQIPKTVTVKSNANYSFNILSYEKDLSNLLETEKFLDILSDGDKRKVYDYNPGGNSEFQQFLMEYPFYDAAIDFSEYTEDMKLDQVDSSFSVDKEFTFSSQDQINSLIKPMGVKEMTVNGQPFDGSSFTFDLTQENAATNAKFKSIKYSAGTMRVYYMGTCTGVTLSTSLNGESRSSSGSYSTGNKTVNIPGEGSYSFDKYYDIPFTPSGKTEFTFSDLTISFTGGVSAFYCEIIDGVIEGISASAQFDDFDPDIQQNVPLTGISESISSVTFAEGNGLKITYDNTLPEGNDILLKAGCEFLDIPADTPLTLTAGTTNETAKLSGTTHNSHSLDSEPAMNFTGKLYLPGVSPGATGEDLKKAILTNVKPGETYRIKISAEPVIKWSEVVVKVPGQALEGTVDTGISLGTLLGDFLDDDSKSKLSFEGVETRIYLEKPNNAGNLFDSISFTGSNINIKLSGDSPTETMELNRFVDPVKLEKQGDTVITDVSKKSASAEKDLSDFLKSAVNSSAQVQLNYKITMEGSNVTITKAQYEAMTSGSNEKPHLKAVAYIIMPFKFKIDGSATPLNPDAKIDLNKIAGLGEDDILGRTSFGDNSAYDAAAMIEKVGVHFNMSNLPIYTNDNDFGVEFDLGTYNDLGEKTSSPKHLALKGDTLKLSSEEIIDFIRYKTVPGLKVVLKDGKTYGLKRNANKVIKVNAGIDFHVDGYVKMGVGANGEAIDFGGAE